MNWNEIEGKWEQITGKVKEKWGKFTNDDITMIKGKKDQLLGKLRERYGYTHEQATKEADLFVQNCSCAKK
jgi:uncharacterized protein YjbJ (UPF0337 family)